MGQLNLKEMHTLVGHVMESYCYISKKVRELEKEVNELKGIEPKKQEKEEDDDGTVLIRTKYHHMQILMQKKEIDKNEN